MITEVEMLDVEIKKLERTMRVLYEYHEELECSGSKLYDVCDSIAILVREKKTYRSSLIAWIEHIEYVKSRS